MTEMLPSTGEYYDEKLLVREIFFASDEKLKNDPRTVMVTYTEAMNDATLSPEYRRTAIRSIVTLAESFNEIAGPLVGDKSYSKSLVVPIEDKNAQLTYGITHAETQKGASAHLFTLYISQGDHYRLLGVYSNAGGTIETRDSLEFPPNEFAMNAFRVVPDELAARLSPLLHGEIIPGRTLEQEMMTIYMSVLDSDEVNADEFIIELRAHYEKQQEFIGFKRQMNAMNVMSIERMQEVVRHLKGGPLTIPVLGDALE